jgi:microcystin-dependent protein
MSVQTPNMNLIQPTIGVDSGLVWEQGTNANSSILDGHNHTAGSGVQIPPAGIDINTSLPFNNNSAISLQASVYQTQTSFAPLFSTYFIGNNYYINDGAGNVIQVTSGGEVLALNSGIATGSAQASFVSSILTVISAPNTPADIQGGSLLLGNTTANSKFLTLSPPAAMAANYTLTLPAGNGSGQLAIMTMDTSNNMAANVNVDNVTLTISSNVLQVAAGFGVIPTGSFIPYGGTSVPTGYLLCNGAAVSRTTYATLFSIIGTANGIGDGSTTFNVPDMRGMFVRGVTGASGNDPDAGSRSAVNGGNGGNNVGSIQGWQIQSHLHSYTYQSAVAGGGGADGGSGNGTLYSHNNTNGNNTDPTGGNQTNPINLYANFIIKT